MSTGTLYEAFAGMVASFAAGLSPALPVSYPGVKFEPPDVGTWLELTWIPNRTENYGLDDSGPSLLQGLAQLSVCYRPGAGIVDGSMLVDAIIAAFGKGTVLAGTVRIDRKPWGGSAIEQSERIAIPVTIPWRGFDA